MSKRNLYPICGIVNPDGTRCESRVSTPEFPRPCPMPIWICRMHQSLLRQWLTAEAETIYAWSKRQAEQPVRQGEKRTALVYFLLRRDGLIKIGFTTYFKRRYAQLTKEHGSLRILGLFPGGRLFEKLLHERFASTRVEGEWFEPSEELARVLHDLTRRQNKRYGVGRSTPEVESVLCDIGMSTASS